MVRATLASLLSGMLFLAIPVAEADVVHTSDGSRLVGKIIRLSDGVLTIETQIAGTIELESAQVVGIETDEAIHIELNSGDRVVGKASKSGDEGPTVVEGELGAIDVPVDRMTGIWREGDDSPEMLAAQRAAGEEIARYKPDWSLTGEAGAAYTEGNTETLGVRGRLDLVRKTQEDTLRFFLAADYNEQDKVRSRNEYRGGVKYERLLTKRFFWYTNLELEHDEFENLDLRATANVGVGYYFLKEVGHELKARGGVGYRHETYDNGTDSDDATLDVGLDYLVDINDWTRFTHSATYSPSFERFSDYRLAFDTAFVFPLGERANRWNLKLGMLNFYNSRPVPPNEELDTTIYANMLVELIE